MRVAFKWKRMNREKTTSPKRKSSNEKVKHKKFGARKRFNVHFKFLSMCRVHTHTHTNGIALVSMSSFVKFSFTWELNAAPTPSVIFLFSHFFCLTFLAAGTFQLVWNKRQNQYTCKQLKSLCICSLRWNCERFRLK